MYFYNIGYNGWEECPNIALSHKTKFSTDEFNEILVDLYSIAFHAMQDRLVNLKDVDNHTREYLNNITVSLLYQQVIEMLISDHGFEYLEITAEFYPSDEYINKIQEGEVEDEYLKLIRNRINVIDVRDNKINNII